MALNISIPVRRPQTPFESMAENQSTLNSLTDQNLSNRIKGVQAQYAPLTVQSQALSKLAYSNLMGPQFLSKLMGHPEILANMSEQQRNNALQMLYSAGTGQYVPNAITGNNVFPSNRQMQNPIQQTYPQSQQYSPDEVSTATHAWLNSPQAQQQQQNEGMIQIPQQDQLMGWYRNNNQPQQGISQPMQIPSSQPSNWAQRTGEFQGLEEQGKEAGKLRAKNISDFGDTYQGTLTKETTLNDLGNLLVSPTMMQMRQLPIGQHYEISYYSKFGTPEQQKAVGQLKTDIGEVVRDSASDFKGQFRVGEQALLNSMKVNDDDTLDVAIGKWESLAYFNKMMQQRSLLASRLMENQHLNKTDALDQANSMLNIDQIKNNIHSMINPMVTIRNKRTGEIRKVPFDQAQNIASVGQ